jgi:hypothetical protein
MGHFFISKEHTAAKNMPPERARCHRTAQGGLHTASAIPPV